LVLRLTYQTCRQFRSKLTPNTHPLDAMA
jgi:hypothetical protein